uniref:FAD/NAD(P)-binding domain-containing protein n=1 Tax=Acrobeloides nanus TaxID=290746 RepID=A0A914CDR5_9BILA
MKSLVVLGTGWASYSVVRNINRQFYRVIVISPRNHFLFTPLLTSTTVGTLEFRSIIEPVRNVGFTNSHDFHLAEALNCDFEKQIVTVQSSLDKNMVWDIPYDKLVIGVGSLPNTFNVPGVKENAFFLKEISDARQIRQKILRNLELELAPKCSKEEVKRLLHTVIVGGGPTGVEFGAELYDFIRKILTDEYLRIASDQYNNSYAIGDCSTIQHNPLPCTAQVAERQGRYIAKSLNEIANNGYVYLTPSKPFIFKSRGMLAYIGENKALSDLPEFKLKGISSWVLWRSAYFTRLSSWRLRIQVPLDWFKIWLFGRDTSRF